MLIINAFRDFTQGLVRGLSLFLMERRAYDDCFTIPEAVPVRSLTRTQAETRKPKLI